MLKFISRKENDSTINSTINSTIKLNETESIVLDFIKSDTFITLVTIANKIGKDLSTVKKTIKSLKEKGLIERIGSNKSEQWMIK